MIKFSHFPFLQFFGFWFFASCVWTITIEYNFTIIFCQWIHSNLKIFWFQHFFRISYEFQGQARSISVYTFFWQIQSEFVLLSWFTSDGSGSYPLLFFNFRLGFLPGFKHNCTTQMLRFVVNVFIIIYDIIIRRH